MPPTLLLGSNLLHRDGVVGAQFVYAQQVISSTRTLIMLSLVTSITGRSFGVVFRLFAAAAAGFMALDLALPPLTALTVLDLPRKLLFGMLGVYYLGALGERRSGGGARTRSRSSSG